MGSSGWGSAGKHTFQQTPVDVFQRFQVGHVNVFVHLVDAGVDGTEFYNLGANAGDEAPVGGATGGRELGLPARDMADGRGQRGTQFAFRGQKGFATQGPDNIVVELVPVKDIKHPLLEVVGRTGGGEAEIEIEHGGSGHHVR